MPRVVARRAPLDSQQTGLCRITVDGPAGQHYGELEQRLDVVTSRPVRRARPPCAVEVGDGVIKQSQVPGRRGRW